MPQPRVTGMDVEPVIDQLVRLGPLASQYGWPAVFGAVCLPMLLKLVSAHIALIKALTDELPKIRRNQRVGIKATKSQTQAIDAQTTATSALTRAMQEMGSRTAAASPAA